jgi:uncharacterized protein (TIGR03067 family)
MRAVALTLFVLGAAVVSSSGPGVAAAPVPKHLMKEPEGEQAKFEGKWKVVSIRAAGEELVTGAATLDIEMEFRGDRLTATVRTGGKVSLTSTATVKYATGGERQIRTTDERAVDGDGKPIDNDTGKDEPLGYAFDGEKLLIAEKVDPLKAGPNDTVVVLTRVKEK